MGGICNKKSKKEKISPDNRSSDEKDTVNESTNMKNEYSEKNSHGENAQAYALKHPKGGNEFKAKTNFSKANDSHSKGSKPSEHNNDSNSKGSDNSLKEQSSKPSDQMNDLKQKGPDSTLKTNPYVNDRGSVVMATPSNPLESLKDPDRKSSGETFRYTNLINRDLDFKTIANSIEEYLNSKEVPEEKLRVALDILKDLTEEENEDPKILIEKFLGLVEKHYRRLFEEFEERNQASKPLIKLLQICDLVVEKYKNEKQGKDFVERIYKTLMDKKMIIKDWRFLRKLCELRECETSWRGYLVQGFLKKIQNLKRALIWKDETEGVKNASEMLDLISKLSEETLFQSLLMGRFDKKQMGISFSIIIGDEGGLFMLLNKVAPGSKEERFILDSGVSEEFLREKREKNDKVILGKGAFGKVSLAVSISGSVKVDVGQLVCVKKSLPIGVKKTKETNLLKRIMDSTLEDFFTKKLNDSIHSPMPIDMAILTSNLNDKKNRKGYLIMELVPENTADRMFREEKFQKWEYQKPYILAVMKTTNDILLEERVFNSDLKPPNTLFDFLSRKMAIIDLGSSLLINEDQNLEEFDASVGGFGVSEPYCPPEIKVEDQLIKLNLNKAISYLCGITIAEVIYGIEAVKKAKKEDDWQFTAENTDLDSDSKAILKTIIKGLTKKDPSTRHSLSEAIASVEKIGLEADKIMKKATSEQYIEKLRNLIKENPSVLSLNEDINETREKGIIDQMVVESNPKRSKHQKTRELKKELENFLNNNNVKADEKKLLVLLGEAGSGKSLALQLRFIEEVEKWEYGKQALPLFFNMADEVNLEKVVNRLNAMLGCNIQLDDPNNDEIHLFIDSYDESRPEDVIKSNTKNEGEMENDKKEESEKKTSVIEQYFHKLSKWKTSKLVISCRTDFVQGEGDDNLSQFQVPSLNSMSVRYITPVDYGNTNNNQDNFLFRVRDWLVREKRKEEPGEIMRIIKKHALESQMGTGLMFNMIMKMTLKWQGDNLNELGLTGFEIYRKTIEEEFRTNWEKIVSGKKSNDKKSEKQKEQFSAIKEEIQKMFKVDEEEISQKRLHLKDGKEVIWEGMERIGELIAAEMSLSKSNRIRYKEIERFLGQRVKKTGEEKMDSDLDERTEWKTLYHILRIMGLKLEKRKSIIKIEDNQKDQTKKFKEENEIIIDIGFRHETYKNYYLLRGIKRLLPVVLKDINTENSIVNEDTEIIQSKKIVAALLEEERVITNYELMRFVGEEIQTFKDSILRQELRKMLYLEQKYRREGIMNEKQEPFKAFEGGLEKTAKVSRSAIIISFLVAGSYQFSGEDLSDLDLAGAYMRGGMFSMSKFERTNLRNANLRHANVSQASFVNTDLRGIQLGVWPDLIGHPEGVTSVCFSPDGKLIATGSWDKTVRVWDSGSGECVQTLEGHSLTAYTVSFSPDGKKLLSGSYDRTAKIWDSGSGECVHTLAGHSQEVQSVCFSPEGAKAVTGSFDKTVKIWDSESGACLQTLVGHSGQVSSVHFSPDGKKLATGGSDQTVKIWDSGTGECVQTFESDGGVYSVCFSPNGKKVATGTHNCTVKIWDTGSGECLQSLTGYNGGVSSVCFSPDGKIVATGSFDRTVKIWETESGECVQNLAGHSGAVSSVYFSPDGKRVATASYDKTVKIWDSGNGEYVQTLAGHSKEVLAVCFSPDGKKVATASSDKTVKIWDCGIGECVQTLAEHSSGVASVCFSPDGKKVASGSWDQTAKIWESGSGECLQTLAGHSGQVSSVNFSPDGKTLATGSFDKAVKIWDSGSGECVQTLWGNSQEVFSVSFNPEGKKVALGSLDNIVKIYDSITGECVKTLAGHSWGVHSLCFSPDGNILATASGDKTVKIWDSGSGELMQTLEGHSGAVYSVNFSPDGKSLATGGSDKTVKIWGSETKALLLTEGVSNGNNMFSSNNQFQMSYFLKWSKSLFEIEFKCDSTIIVSCLMDKDKELDRRNEIVLNQRKGKVYN